MSALRKEMRGDRPERGERAERGEKGERAAKGERAERRERERLNPVERLERMAQRSAAAAESARQVRTALPPPYESMSDEQKKTANRSEEPLRGKECVTPCRQRGLPDQ